MRIHPVFNTVRLRPYHEDTIPGRLPDPRPDPVIGGDDPQWDVEFIKDSRIRRGKLQFLLKWKGYPHEESTWTKAEDMFDADHLIRESYERHPSAPRLP